MSLGHSEVAGDNVYGLNVVVADLNVDTRAILGQTLPTDKGAEPPLEDLLVTESATVFQPLEVARGLFSKAKRDGGKMWGLLGC